MLQSYHSKGVGVGIGRANESNAVFSRLVQQVDVDISDKERRVRFKANLENVDIESTNPSNAEISGRVQQVGVVDSNDKERRVRFKFNLEHTDLSPPAPLKSQLQLHDSDDNGEIPLESDTESYVDPQRKFIEEIEYGRFPKRMLDQLEAVRKRRGPADALTRTGPRTVYAVIWEHDLGTGDGWERHIVGVGLDRDRANTKAMATFCKKNDGHMVDPKFSQKGMSALKNLMGSPFHFVEGRY